MPRFFLEAITYALITSLLVVIKLYSFNFGLSIVDLSVVFFLILIWPGFLISRCCFQAMLPISVCIPVAFGLSLGLWSIPGFYLLLNQYNIEVMSWAVVGLLVLITLVTIFVRYVRISQEEIQTKVRSNGITSTTMREHWLLTLFTLSLVGIILYLFSTVNNLHPASDRISYQAFIRHFIDTDKFLGHGLYISIDRIPVIGRHLTQTWLLVIALVVELSSTDLLRSYVYLLPPILLVISFLAVHSFAWELTNSYRTALMVVCIQSIYIVTDIDPLGDGIGYNFLFRILEDKFLLMFVLMPTSWWLIFRYLSTGLFPYFLCLSLLIIANVTIHPMGIVLFGLSLGLFSFAHIASNFQRESVIRTALIFAVVVLLAWIPLWQRQATSERLSLQFEGANSISESLTELRLGRLSVISETPPNYTLRPSLISHPIEILAIIFAVCLLFYLRKNKANQFLVSNMFGVLALCYTPYITPILGSIITPWMIWRVLWLLPISLTIGYVLNQAWLGVERKRSLSSKVSRNLAQVVFISAAICALVGLYSYIDYGHDRINVRNQRALSKDEVETLRYLRNFAEPESKIFAQGSRITDEIPTIVGHSFGLTFQSSPPLTNTALQDLSRFYEAKFVSNLHLELLDSYEVDFVIAEANKEITYQFEQLPILFKQLHRNDSLIIYQIAKQPGPLEKTVILANTSLLAGDFPVAEANFRTVLDEEPEHLLAIVGLGYLNTLNGRHKDAIGYYTLAQAKAPQISAISDYLAVEYAALADELAKASNVLDSFEYYEQALATAPFNSEVRTAILDYISNFKSLPQMAALENKLVKSSRKELEQSPYNQDLYLQLISILNQLERYGDAAELLESLEQKMEPTPGFYFSLAEIYESNLQIDEAISAYQNVIADKPELISAYRRLSQIYLGKGMSEEAKTIMEKAVKENPDDANARASLGLFYKNLSESSFLSD